jgi:hypothetical protein
MNFSKNDKKVEIVLDPVRGGGKSLTFITPLHEMLKDIGIEQNSDKTMVEIGSYIGESATVFSNYFKIVYCVDIWGWYSENKIWKYSNEIYPPAEREFDKQTKDLKNLIKVKEYSDAAVKRFENNTLDFVYIDAGHSYEDCKKDILIWKEKVKKGCYLAGHDWEWPTSPGVKKAIIEIFGMPDKTYDDTSWVKKME